MLKVRVVLGVVKTVIYSLFNEIMIKTRPKVTFQEFEAERPANYEEMLNHADDYIMDCLITKFFERRSNKVENTVNIC